VEDKGPRLRALPDDEIAPRAKPIIESWNLNLHRTLAHSPDMLADWLPWAERVLRGNSLSERDREIVILRVAVQWRSDYEWGLHALLARRIGMTEADLKAVAAGPADPHWAAFEATLLEATDQVLDRQPIDDALWTILSRAYSGQQLVDLMMTIAEFSLVAMMLTTFRIPLESRPNLPHLADYMPRTTSTDIRRSA
jgi:4-carboxymuconolactone decarboxylase